MSLKSIIKSRYFPSIVLLFILTSYAFTNYSKNTVSVSVSKMNVLYTGVDNPIVVAIAGVPSDKTTIESDDMEIESIGEGRYIVNVSTPGNAKIKVMADGQIVQEVLFRVKRIPNPVARINGNEGGFVKKEILQVGEGIIAYINCFDFDARCLIKGYDIIRIREGNDAIVYTNNGPRFETETKRIIQNLKVGDTVYFEKIKCRCPGDRFSRNLNSMIFQIR